MIPGVLTREMMDARNYYLDRHPIPTSSNFIDRVRGYLGNPSVPSDEEILDQYREHETRRKWAKDNVIYSVIENIGLGGLAHAIHAATHSFERKYEQAKERGGDAVVVSYDGKTGVRR